ncbi:HipA N-terminal domain-containing protein (plasmid) [Klebsiella quasipneumoniae]|nr:HipA N-terminal domain-containing protein [Klebsiella quasipneumoniae]
MVRKQQRYSDMDERHSGRVLGKSKGDDSLRYLTEWVADEQGRPLSLSLPFTPGNQILHGNVVRDYFDNLLPDRLC